MSSRLNLTLISPQQAKPLLGDMWSWIKAQTMAGNKVQLEAKTETRSLAENRLLHAMLTHISKNQEWAGQKRDVDTWKRLLIAAWCRATGDPVELLPALDGMGVDIVFRRSSKLSRKECAELIEFIYAWGLQNDVHFPASKEETKLYEKSVVSAKIDEPAKLLEQQCGL